MDEPQFRDPKRAPTDAELAGVLGRTYSHWRKLVDGVAAIEPKAAGEWRFYKSYGWTFILNDKRRNLLYLRPGHRCIMASMALGEKAYNTALVAELPPDLIADLLQAPKYPEGWPARVTVRTAADAKTVLKLVQLKAAK
jgi:hypothetical protein